MKIKKSNMSYFAPSPNPVLSRCLLVLAVNDFCRSLRGTSLLTTSEQ
jgi:hypothetical protein